MANIKSVSKKTKAQAMGMHTEVLTGRTQQKFFNPDEAENFYYFGTHDVDFNKRTDLDVKDMTAAEANKEIDNLMGQGYGTIVIKNPQGKHSLGVGILNKLNLIFEGSLGYFGMGSCDGPIVRINGRVGWSCAENLMAGKVVIEKNAGSCFGAAIRGGDLICKGSVGARTGIDMKGGTIIIGGDAGAFTGTYGESFGILDEEKDKYDEVILEDKENELEKPKNIKKQKTKQVNFFKLLLVFIISFVAFVLVVDTFVVQISEYVPFTEKYLDNLYQSIIDISLFFQNLIK